MSLESRTISYVFVATTLYSHFVYSSIHSHSGTGSRVFDVSAEDIGFEGVDIVAEANGAFTALILPPMEVEVQDDFLTVSLSSLIDNAKISAIEIHQSVSR